MLGGSCAAQQLFCATTMLFGSCPVPPLCSAASVGRSTQFVSVEFEFEFGLVSVSVQVRLNVGSSIIRISMSVLSTKALKAPRYGVVYDVG